MFSRTLAGLVNKFLFYPKPIVWVEGYDDFPFYEPIIKDSNCRIETACGKDNCLVLAQNIIQKDYPFIVILDGDYGILENQGNPHKRVILLKKYSIENYFFDLSLMQKICSKYIGTEEYLTEIDTLFRKTERDLQNSLFDLVVLDVTNYRKDMGLKVFPEKADPVLDVKKMRCISGKIQEIYNLLIGEFKEEDIFEMKALIETFLQKNSFTDLLRGHFLFGVLRYFIFNCVRNLKSDRKPNIDNDSLLIMLSLELWNIIPTTSHRTLLQDVKEAATDAWRIKNLQTIK